MFDVIVSRVSVMKTIRLLLLIKLHLKEDAEYLFISSSDTWKLMVLD